MGVCIDGEFRNGSLYKCGVFGNGVAPITFIVITAIVFTVIHAAANSNC